jgi:hypothetical protein
VKDIKYEASRSLEFVQEIADKQREGGVNVLFIGGNREAMQELVTLLADYSGLNVHRINVAGLVGDRANQTRGNLREAFDNAKENAAILVLDHAGEMLAEVETREGSPEEGAHTGSDYLFQRVEAFKGICILQVADSAYVDEVLEHDLQFVVRF